jgi:glycosyltransferase involved in cell wall biosynthesis
VIAFVQPFALHAAGGGSRILRALLQGEHPPALSLYTGLLAPPPSPHVEEIHLPNRPAFGRLEWTRFQRHLRVFDGIFRSRFEGQLRQVIHQRKIKLLHIIPHVYDFVPVWNVASQLELPFFLTVHDDLEYLAGGHPLTGQMLAAMGQAWRSAKGIFVISDEIGKEYAARYGPREYQVITDGIAVAAEAPLPRPARSLRIYFMGLFHFRYTANFRALLDALKSIRKEHPDWDISVVCRCGSIFGSLKEDDVPVQVLPFAPESEVEKDMLSADLLYQPLPFEAEAVNFGKFSLSTKLVTYLGSGLPILYHGPSDTAACNLLTRHDAAVVCTTLDPQAIAGQLVAAFDRRESIVNNALQLARHRFMLADQQRRFWQPIEAAL